MDSETHLVPSMVRSVLVGFYSWIAIVFFGAVLLDVVYANAIRGVLDSGETAAVFSEAADFLLLIAALTVLAAVGAIGSSWKSALARNLLIASALLIVSELLAPIFLAPLLQDGNAGLWLRLLGSASVSVLSLLGSTQFYLRS